MYSGEDKKVVLPTGNLIMKSVDTKTIKMVKRLNIMNINGESEMKRNITLSEISDGKLYDLNDLVKADCGGCIGCSACCQGMGTSIVLDPLDIYHLTKGLECTFEQLLNNKIELNVVDHTILPNLKMIEEKESCSFLNEEGRCSIHSFRPGICRIFPLGRVYENNSFKYFLQIHECKKEMKSKIKVRKWIDIPDIQLTEKFINDWNYYIKGLQEEFASCEDENYIRQMNLFIINQFFMKPYDTKKDFFTQFYERF